MTRIETQDCKLADFLDTFNFNESALELVDFFGEQEYSKCIADVGNFPLYGVRGSRAFS